MLKWENLSLWDKLRLVKLWYFVVLVGDLCLILGVTMLIFSATYDLSYGEAFIGVGTLCIWASIVKYL